MRRLILGFAVGVALLQCGAELPSASVLWLLAALGTGACGAALGLCHRGGRGAWRALGVFGAALLGFAWAAALAQGRLAERLPAASEGQDMVVTGVVASLPQAGDFGLRFDFDIEQASLPASSRVALSWVQRGGDEAAPRLPPPHAGERWRFTVRLKRPHGNVNPHGFDYEGWLFERGIGATGYVRGEGAERLDTHVWRPAYLVEMAREALRARYRAALGEAPYAGILIALAIGDQRAIAPELWQTFARTGVTHLMSISGLHVTMVAGLAAWLAGWLWRRSPRLMLWQPSQRAAAIGGLLAALAYSLLAGFAVPAQRTLYMLAVAALAQVSGREMGASRVLALALLAVLLLDPWAVLAPGFWLSFGAVAVLFLIGSGRLGGAHWFVEWARAQWAVTLGMLPALLLLFQQFSLVSPLANAVAIPLVSFVITPLALLGVLPGLTFLLSLAHVVTEALLVGLDLLARLPWATWQQAAPPAWAVALALLGGAWLLLPRGVPARWLGLLTFLPLLSFTPPRPAPGALRATVLDVGQGLAVHVQTARHDLLFDAGPAFSAEADSGNRIIAPYLRGEGVRRLDLLLVSHADRDHSGGAESVLAALPVALLSSSLPFEHGLSSQAVVHRACQDGQAWEWDGVRFALLHPQAADLAAAGIKSNDLSCVLSVEAGGRRLLLPSDIEAVSEAALLARHRPELAATVLLAPHHGSRTSSTPEFIAAVGAREVVFAAGYRNRFGHPRPDVVARYAASGARLHRTDAAGAVRIDMNADGIAIAHQRQTVRRYWQAYDSAP